jgi:hypothetical protein
LTQLISSVHLAAPGGAAFLSAVGRQEPGNTARSRGDQVGENRHQEQATNHHHDDRGQEFVVVRKLPRPFSSFANVPEVAMAMRMRGHRRRGRFGFRKCVHWTGPGSVLISSIRSMATGRSTDTHQRAIARTWRPRTLLIPIAIVNAVNLKPDALQYGTGNPSGPYTVTWSPLLREGNRQAPRPAPVS